MPTCQERRLEAQCSQVHRLVLVYNAQNFNNTQLPAHVCVLGGWRVYLSGMCFDSSGDQHHWRTGKVTLLLPCRAPVDVDRIPNPHALQQLRNHNRTCEGQRTYLRYTAAGPLHSYGQV